ncbi:MAG: DEAD/DEAH box helicase [Verrucomicrobiaceae bacterium]|nr:DEAD/DEAH box helicase [Verrucomicrobiaceae bacterium]
MSSALKSRQIAPGSRIIVRDEEWLVRRIEKTSSGDDILAVVGLTELVKDREARFIKGKGLDSDIVAVDPADTQPVADTSAYHRNTLLHLETLLRASPPTDDRLHLGHRGAMDVVPYQLDPSRLALQQPRQRILIADAVGLGKTIECGVLLSELIARGRGRRILVLTVKSMLTQFQKEMWARFSIPLVRMDSDAIQRLRSKLPSNHNPFHYFDKTIVSIDTIKQDTDYRVFLENAWWDIIVIDEAHNVAERKGNHSSLRAQVAKLLSERSDSLILLSATPHDGSKESFASILNMLDPTAIKDPSNYGPEDIKGLFIRRFKKDIKYQVRGAFPERVVTRTYAEASLVEDHAFGLLAELKLTALDSQRRSGEMLFRTTLEKALLSSPAACLETVNRRLKTIAERSDAARFAGDVPQLTQLRDAIAAISPAAFSKYQRLLLMLRSGSESIAWTPASTEDRLVIFSERLATVEFLTANLARDLKLKPDAIAILHGGLSDVDQQKIVEQFGSKSSPLRILVASDVASEGINLHYLSHRLIHFDIPWSLLTFQQRNGRVDRYGQQKQPHLYYLLTQSDHLRGDGRILEILIEKDEQVQKNIGDPSEFTGIHDAAVEEGRVAQAIEEGMDAGQFESFLGSAKTEEDDWLRSLLEHIDQTPASAEAEAASVTADRPTLFTSDYHWAKEVLNYLRVEQPHAAPKAECLDLAQEIHLPVTPDLHQRLDRLPKEIRPDDGTWILTTDRQKVMNEITACRADEGRWPKQTLLWEQHPLMQWLSDKILAAFGRQQAPVIRLPVPRLQPGEVIILATGILPNRKGHPLLQRWMGVQFLNGKSTSVLPLEDILQRTRLGKDPAPQSGAEIPTEALSKLVPVAVEAVRAELSRARKDFDEKNKPALDAQLARLSAFRDARCSQLEFQFEESKTRGLASTLDHRRLETERRKRSVDHLHENYVKWIRDTLQTEDNPAIRIVAFLIH